MRLGLIGFTRAGAVLCGRLNRLLAGQGYCCEGYVPRRFWDGSEETVPLTESLEAWSGRCFEEMDGLIYIGAAGIAVRAIAPFLKDKMTDPAVVVVDEGGNFAISLLSGHVGGANRLARTVAELLGAEPVITTATDVRGRTAIDTWASERGLWISDRVIAKEMAAALLENEPLGFFADFPVGEALPDGCRRNQPLARNLWATVKKNVEKDFPASGASVLRLVPRALTVGVGCRKGMSYEDILTQVRKGLSEGNLDEKAVACIASIDLKAAEAGLCRLAEEWEVPFVTFSAGKLEQVRGPVEESAFVRQVTGTGNVCERAALLAAGEDSRLLVTKRAGAGVTVAVALPADPAGFSRRWKEAGFEGGERDGGCDHFRRDDGRA